MKKLTIGIDASRAVRLSRTGTETYSFEIINHLLKTPSPHSFILYAPTKLPDNRYDLPNVEWRIIPQRRLWSQVGLAGEIRSNPPDVLFVPSHVVPLLSTVSSVVTIHDLAYEYFKDAYSPIERRYLKYSTGVSINKAKRVIVPSESTKKDVLKFYPAAEKKVRVISHGYDASLYHTAQKTSANFKQYDYIYSIGRLEERKNTSLLVKAFALLAKDHRTLRLVLAGRPGYGHEKIDSIITGLPLGVRERIIRPGFISTADSVKYLRGARVFAFPSLYEGFGLPILEAMASGVPVVCSNSSSLPEVAGSAALSIAPIDPLSWAAALKRVLDNKDVSTKMISDGLIQVKKFSWDEAAVKTLKSIEEASHE